MEDGLQWDLFDEDYLLSSTQSPTDEFSCTEMPPFFGRDSLSLTNYFEQGLSGSDDNSSLLLTHGINNRCSAAGTKNGSGESILCSPQLPLFDGFDCDEKLEPPLLCGDGCVASSIKQEPVEELNDTDARTALGRSIQVKLEPASNGLNNEPFEVEWKLKEASSIVNNGEYFFTPQSSVIRDPKAKDSSRTNIGGGTLKASMIRPRFIVATAANFAYRKIYTKGSSVSQTEQSSSDGSGVFGVTRCGSTGSIHSAPYFTQRIRSKVQDLAVKSRLITDQSHRDGSCLSLTNEEKRTLVQEGFPIPFRLPLTKAEEDSLKLIRRKIKNKLSAQESRRKRKEYIDTLEQRVQDIQNENGSLRQRLRQLEQTNRTLAAHMKRLQQKHFGFGAVSGPTSPASPVSARLTPNSNSACLTVLILAFMLAVPQISTLLGTSRLVDINPAVAIGCKTSMDAFALDFGTLADCAIHRKDFSQDLPSVDSGQKMISFPGTGSRLIDADSTVIHVQETVHTKVIDDLPFNFTGSPSSLVIA